MLISHPLKLLSKAIYKGLNTDTLPILGRGPRPVGAKYCGCFITESNLNGVSKSFGMPSGHSITAHLCLPSGFYISKNIQDLYRRNSNYIRINISA